MADMSGIEKAVRVALGGAVTSVTWASRGALQQQQQQQLQQLQLQQQQLQQQQMQQQLPMQQSRFDAQRSFASAATSASGLGPIGQQPYAAAGMMTSPMTSQQVRAATSPYREQKCAVKYSR